MAHKIVNRKVPGDRTQYVVDVQFPASYVTGGMSLKASDVPGITRGRIRHVDVGMCATAGVASPTKTAVWDHVNSKLLLYTAYPATEAGNTSNQSTVTVRCLIDVK